MYVRISCTFINYICTGMYMYDSVADFTHYPLSIHVHNILLILMKPVIYSSKLTLHLIHAHTYIRDTYTCVQVVLYKNILNKISMYLDIKHLLLVKMCQLDQWSLSCSQCLNPMNSTVATYVYIANYI